KTTPGLCYFQSRSRTSFKPEHDGSDSYRHHVSRCLFEADRSLALARLFRVEFQCPKMTDPKRGPSCAWGQDSAGGIAGWGGLSRDQQPICARRVEQPCSLRYGRAAGIVYGWVSTQCPTVASGVAVSLYSAPSVVNTLSFRSIRAPVVLSMMM